MHWKRQIIALKAQSRTLQIFDLEQKKKLKSCTMSEDVQYWKWISESTLGLITPTSVYHWDVYDAGQDAPVKVFERNANLNVRICFSLRFSAMKCSNSFRRAAKSSTTALTPMASGW